MSVASWGEDPRGSWFLDILDEVTDLYVKKLFPMNLVNKVTVGNKRQFNLYNLICARVSSRQTGPEENNGTIKAFTLILHGTRRMPAYRKNGPRIYNQDYNRIRNIVSRINLIPPRLINRQRPCPCTRVP